MGDESTAFCVGVAIAVVFGFVIWALTDSSHTYKCTPEQAERVARWATMEDQGRDGQAYRLERGKGLFCEKVEEQ
jgi:hypothetical protein